MRAPPTPSSVKWLITRRARIAGEIEKLDRREIERVADAKKELRAAFQKLWQLRAQHTIENSVNATLCRSLLRDLEAIDLVFGYHEIQIDPNRITPTQGHEKRSALAYSEMTTAIYTCLKAGETSGGKLRHIRGGPTLDAHKESLNLRANGIRAFVLFTREFFLV